MTRITNRTAVVRKQRLRTIDSAVSTAHLIGAARRRAFWFKPPATWYPKLTASRVAKLYDVPREFVPEPDESAAAYVERELHRPSSTLNHRTAHFAGKPYHWRQDYTGQLKLAAGESPW